jgi:hypothetical protein
MSGRLRIPGFFVVCIALAALSAPVDAGDHWELLGDRMVNDRVDHDEIAVTSARGDWEALKFKVKKAPIRIYDMKVQYGNGVVDDIPVRALIPAGGESRVIDLRGGHDRVIRRVTFWYDAKTLGPKRAEIRLFGRR